MVLSSSLRQFFSQIEEYMKIIRTYKKAICELEPPITSSVNKRKPFVANVKNIIKDSARLFLMYNIIEMINNIVPIISYLYFVLDIA